MPVLSMRFEVWESLWLVQIVDLSFVEFMSKGHTFLVEQGESLRQEVSISVEGAGRCSFCGLSEGK